MAGLLPFLRDKHLNLLFLIGASLIVIGMPYSIVLMSVGSIWISAVYILEGDYRDKLQALKNPIISSVLLFFLVYIIGLMWTENVSQGVKEIKKVLPFMSIPVVFSGINSVTKKQKEGLLWLFVAATLSSILFIYVWGYSKGTLSSRDPRDISIFTSHIRLSLFVCLCVSWVVFSRAKWWLKLVIIIPLLSFIAVVQSLTGVSVLLALLVSVLVGFLSFKRVSVLKWLKYSTLFFLVLITLFLTYTTYDFYSVKNSETTPDLTENGLKYNPELENGFIENGSYLWSFVSYEELEKGFKEKTGKSIWENGENGFTYYGTLIRYLNNKGLTKDFKGLENLSPEEFDRILNGNPYPDTWKHKGFSKRIRGILFQLEKGRFSPDFSGNSLTEKVVFQTAGLVSYLNNPLLGAGTGDLTLELDKYYEEHYPELPKELRRKPHNQYLTYLIMFGPIGLLIFLAIFYRLLRSKTGEYENVCRTFVIIALMSFLGEDTAGSQAGITFLSFFIGILFLLRTRD